jgi:hypothetical protein
LNLGCGRHRLPDCINIDSCALENPDVVCDLGVDRWPFDDNTVDGAVASHILEHLAGDTFFHFLQELYRVSKNGAVIEVKLPWPTHDIFRQDPTHARPVMPTTLAMFSRKFIDELAAREMYLTDFGRRYGVDFDFDPHIQYVFDKHVDADDPELEWKSRHMNNIIQEWSGRIIARK